jgi:hypothetical protein
MYPPDATLQMQVDPCLPLSRRQLDTQVWIEGKRATSWHLKAPGEDGEAGDRRAVLTVTVPIPADLPNCRARVRLSFLWPHPHSERRRYPRSLQLRELDMRVTYRSGDETTSAKTVPNHDRP